MPPKSSLFFLMLILFLWRGKYWYYIKNVLSNRIVQAFLIFYVISVIGFVYTENIEFAKSSMDKMKFMMFPLFFLTFLDKRFSLRIVAAFSLGIFLSEIVSYAIRFEVFPVELYLFNHEVYSTSLLNPSPFFNHFES